MSKIKVFGWIIVFIFCIAICQSCFGINDTATPTITPTLTATSTPKPTPTNTPTPTPTNTPTPTMYTSQVNSEEPSIDIGESSSEETIVKQSMIDAFIERYNAVAPTPITDAVEVDVTNKESGHYRVEFRLNAFKDSIAKTGKLGDIVIDIVNCGWLKDELRVYVDDITPEQAAEIVKYAAPIMDPTVPEDELQTVLDYLTGAEDYHNGYFGELCMTFNDIHGELMLRTD